MDWRVNRSFASPIAMIDGSTVWQLPAQPMVVLEGCDCVSMGLYLNIKRSLSTPSACSIQAIKFSGGALRDDLVRCMNTISVLDPYLFCDG